MESFELIEKELQHRCWEIQIVGELDLSVAERFQEALDRVAADHDRILIGLERCEFIDSTGVAVIVRAHGKLAEQGRHVSVYGPSDQVLRVLSITGLTDNGLVFRDADEAIAAADGSAAPTA